MTQDIYKEPGKFFRMEDGASQIYLRISMTKKLTWPHKANLMIELEGDVIRAYPLEKAGLAKDEE